MKLPIVSWNDLGTVFGKQSARIIDIPNLPSTQGWQWVLELLDDTMQSDNRRIQTMPNGGFVINSPQIENKSFDFFIDTLKGFGSDSDVVRSQIYIALSIKSQLFSKHTDPGQNSLVWQCSGKTAVEIGECTDILEPGDVIYLNNNIPHRFTSLGPRFSITFSLERE